MCNLYRLHSGPQAILELARAMFNRAGNLEPGNIYPDYPAPIVRNTASPHWRRWLSRVDSWNSQG
jgi:putative SOS response-associated peptidase YedK